MIKRINPVYLKLALLLLMAALFLGACKKDKITPAKPGKTGSDTVVNQHPTVILPDEVMFIGSNQSLDSNKYCIDLLNAATGQFVTRYTYPADGHSDFCKPFARAGLLYDVERDRIRAITMNTGAVLWTDSLDMDNDPASMILHDDTFYGIYYNHTGSPGDGYVYALDATKKSTAYLWKSPLIFGGNVYNLPVNYYNGTIYITDADGSRLTALDAKTGTQKWRIENDKGQYSMASLNFGLIFADYTIIDAASGNPIATVTDPVIPPIAVGAIPQPSSLAYVSNDLYLIQTSQVAGSLQRWFLSAVSRTTGAEKWRAGFGSQFSDNVAARAIDTGKSVLLVWNDKLIVQEIDELYSGRSMPYGLPILTNYTGSLNTLDINTGLFESIAGGESSNITGFANYDGGNIIADNTLYGNYIPNSTNGINVYATDLSTGQLKWKSTPLPYSGIYDVLSCVYSRSQDKAYSPYINLHPGAAAGARLGQAKVKRRG